MLILKNYSKLKPWSLLLLLFACGTTALAQGSTEAPAVLQPQLPEVSIYEPVTSADSQKTRATLPSSYSSVEKNLVTNVKNQGSFGTCWAFAAMSACESSMIKRGIADTSLDLSEFHFAYFFYHSQIDPLGNTAGDLNTLSSGDYLNTGGNDVCSVFTLAKWAGAASESLAPYPSTTDASLDTSLAYEDVGHLQNARYVSCQDKDSIKQFIMQYGSVSAPIYMDSNYLNYSTGAYYCYDAFQTNHQIVLVGWDDSYSRNNFSASGQPSSNGAWIVRNSYGTSFGNNGYMYLSYEDLGLNNTSSLAFAYDMENSSNYSHNYQYDGSSSATYRRFPTSGSLANVFTVKGNPGSRERLEAVSFALASSNVQYSIQIYKNPPAGNPSGGIPVFDSAQTGVTTYCGYYTIPLKQTVVFNQGDRFSVVISLASANGGSVYFFSDETDSISNLQFISTAGSDQSYYKSLGYQRWTDMGSTLNANVRIKAFTTDTTEPATIVLPNVSGLAVPESRNLQAVSCSDVRVSWSAVTYAEGYTIYRSTSKKKGYKAIANVSGLSFTDTGLTCGKRYYYKIKAYGTARQGTVYSPVSAVFSIKMAPPKVSFTSLLKKSSSKVMLTWEPVSGASGYEVYRRAAGGSWKKVKTIKKGTTTQCQVKAAKNKKNLFKIRAYKKVKGSKIYGSFSKTRKIRL